MSLTGLKKDARLRFNRVTREMREENKKEGTTWSWRSLITEGRKKKHGGRFSYRLALMVYIVVYSSILILFFFRLHLYCISLFVILLDISKMASSLPPCVPPSVSRAPSFFFPTISSEEFSTKEKRIRK